MDNYYEELEGEIDPRGGIIDNWLRRSNFNQNAQIDPASPKQYNPKTSLADIMLEGDVALEPFLLNPEADLAKQFEEYCEARLKEASLEPLPIFQKFSNIIKEEKNLWNLVSVIYTDRVQREADLGVVEFDKTDFFQVTDYQVVQKLLQSSGRMSDATVKQIIKI
ncbi:hypothetical protein DSO57_1020126 [Entomophthora muscae]|uniref:Uncharacterized protein n=1 Tax=Entomophthora muscae TaxID=34485 RepID=A0ACC2TEP9_9FUNG|nr:hypothetical protein DSO57_1020126 [Entomophthora muscae]